MGLFVCRVGDMLRFCFCGQLFVTAVAGQACLVGWTCLWRIGLVAISTLEAHCGVGTANSECVGAGNARAQYGQHHQQFQETRFHGWFHLLTLVNVVRSPADPGPVPLWSSAGIAHPLCKLQMVCHKYNITILQV